MPDSIDHDSVLSVRENAADRSKWSYNLSVLVAFIGTGLFFILMSDLLLTNRAEIGLGIYAYVSMLAISAALYCHRRACIDQIKSIALQAKYIDAKPLI